MGRMSRVVPVVFVIVGMLAGAFTLGKTHAQLVAMNTEIQKALCNADCANAACAAIVTAVGTDGCWLHVSYNSAPQNTAENKAIIDASWASMLSGTAQSR